LDPRLDLDLRLGVGLGWAKVGGARVLVALWLVRLLVRAQNMLHRRRRCENLLIFIPLHYFLSRFLTFSYSYSNPYPAHVRTHVQR
jgi:hypothetical protein